MALWQDLLGNGNRCFDNKDYLQAEYYFQQAQACLDELWTHDGKNSRLLTAWITASHNLAALFEYQGNPELALSYLQLPHQRVLAISQDQEYDEDMRLIAQNALRLTLRALLEFAQKYPICQSCLKQLTDLQALIEQDSPRLH
ncbi:DUF2753 family protein [Thalassomonas viridans]|uniref:DUF2753 family protein n=1 Tax=Thalassomonas viridans TaxID=137584 RepID=A0AAE9Z6T8_9GAMM|nr:DUF2753 family protein [Thalassomonas viridans]WDE07070.1 DUF2753 family protein [Thalassomonas viridans]